MNLEKSQTISGRFLRSIRIDSDLHDHGSLERYISQQTSEDILLSMSKHIVDTGQYAFTWTGPYGCGKSSLIVALSALLNCDKKLRDIAYRKFNKNVLESLSHALPNGPKGWRIVPVVGRRETPSQVIGEAIDNAGLTPNVEKSNWSESDVLNSIDHAISKTAKSNSGIAIFIDEMGKLLESAAQDGSDIYLFQQLAELASRSNSRLLIVGILHQAFEEYANLLSREVRDEWTKIQGRFVDLAINTTKEEQIYLISKAIVTNKGGGILKDTCKQVASHVRKNQPKAINKLSSLLFDCKPLHPITTCLLEPISRRRFGQNHRSIFGFLNSAEPHGFQDFINQSSKSDAYFPYQLWDYLRANLESSILASPDGHRWALAVDAMERCEAIGSDNLHIQLLKVVSVIDLFKERSGLHPNFNLISTCFPKISKSQLNKALSQLEDWSMIIFKKYQDSYAIFAGSDFDVEEVLDDTLKEIGDIDFAILNELARIQPILAKRHYHETGVMRWYEVKVCRLRDVKEIISKDGNSTGATGQFLLTIPCDGENENRSLKICKEASKQHSEFDAVVGKTKANNTIDSLARELQALNQIRKKRTELLGDSIARREVESRIAEVTGLLETELIKSYEAANWYCGGKKIPESGHASLNSYASDLADKRFENCPKLHNELLNRNKPSTSGRSAQKLLLHRMVLNEGDKKLGIEGFSAEGGLLISLLEDTKLYTEDKQGNWYFQSPKGGASDKARLFPLWSETLKIIKSSSGQNIKISEIYDVWMRPPFGIKRGIMPTLIVAFILSERQNIAIYREGIFRSTIDDVDIDYLLIDPSNIQIRWLELSTESKALLAGMSEIVRDLGVDIPSKAQNEPIEVARGLIKIFDQLPNWTKRTQSVSKNAQLVRELFVSAHDPNKFIFDDIPEIFGTKRKSISRKETIKNVRDGLSELVKAYSNMIHKLRDFMLIELKSGVNGIEAIEALQKRAENIKNLSGDFRQEAFVGRLSQFNGSDESFESIASLVANKPPRDWIDSNLRDAKVEISKMANMFIKNEAFAHVQNRENKRQSIALVIGLDGKSREPFHEEFQITDSDKRKVKKIASNLNAVLKDVRHNDKKLALAALAEIGAELIKDGSKRSRLKQKG